MVSKHARKHVQLITVLHNIKQVVTGTHSHVFQVTLVKSTLSEGTNSPESIWDLNLLPLEFNVNTLPLSHGNQSHVYTIYILVSLESQNPSELTFTLLFHM